MDKINFQDYLKYSESKEIEEIIGNELILYSDRVIKLNKYNMSREVDFILTDDKIYILKKKSKLSTLNIYNMYRVIQTYTNKEN
jgi:hypothetical protein